MTLRSWLPHVRRRNRRKRRQERRQEPIAMRVPLLQQALRRGLEGVAVVSAVVGVLGGSYAAWRAVGATERLRLHAVHTTGLSRVSDTELLAYAGVQPEVPIMDLDLDTMVARLLRHPWIRTVSVRRRLPDTLLIDVQEHRAAILVSLGDTYLADEVGEVFKRFSISDGIVLPVLTGLTRELLTRDAPVAVQIIQHAMALAQHATGRADVLGRLEELHWDEDLGWSIVTWPRPQPPGLRLHLGKEPSERLPVAVRAVSVLCDSGRAPQEIWVDGIKNPNMVHVRLSARVPASNNETQDDGDKHGIEGIGGRPRHAANWTMFAPSELPQNCSAQHDSSRTTTYGVRENSG